MTSSNRVTESSLKGLVTQLWSELKEISMGQASTPGLATSKNHH